MKRLYTYIMVIVSLLGSVSCQYKEGDTPSGKAMGYYLWTISRTDISRINEIFDYIAYYNHLLTIEDEEERNRYIHLHFGDVSINANGNIHEIHRETSYATLYTTTFEMHSDHWRVKRSGGYGYDLTITPTESGSYRVELNEFYNNESSGIGSFLVNLEYKGNMPVVAYTGELKMTDPEECVTKPLRITSRIVNQLTYTTPSTFTSGVIHITAHDELYDTIDEAKVTILHDQFNNLIIECIGNVSGYSYNY